MKLGYLVVVLAVIGTVSYAVYYKYGNDVSKLLVATHKQVEKAEASQGEQKKAVIVVNVLDKKFYDDAHIAQSIHVPYENLKQEAQKWDKNATIVIYCADYQCGASREGVKELNALGFSDVRAYEGGMAEWYQLHQQDAGYAFEGPAQEKYLARPVKHPQGGSQQDAGIKEISAQELQKLLAR